MPKRIKDEKTGLAIRLEFESRELAEDVLGVKEKDLLNWKELIPPFKEEDGRIIYAVKNKKEFDLIKKRAALLKTGMTETAVENVEQAGLLDSYFELSKDCPEGITAHAWRSYGLVVLMQTKYNIKVDAKELAQRANINKRNSQGKVVADPDMAEKHLRLLQAIGYLTETEDRWEHQGLPLLWQEDN
jgi:hypothetical protein